MRLKLSVSVLLVSQTVAFLDSPLNITYDKGVTDPDKIKIPGTKYTLTQWRNEINVYEKLRRWGADPALRPDCNPNYKKGFCHNRILGVEVEKTTQVPLTNARFDDEDDWICPSSMHIGWRARYAIDGKKYCMNKEECDGEHRLAHSRRSNATFYADFANEADHDVEIGRILWWPREDCCQNQYSKLEVWVGDVQCTAITEWEKDRLPLLGTGQMHVHEMTVSSYIRPVGFKCPPGTKGTGFRMWNPTYFVMITEIEVWTRDTYVSTEPIGEAAGLTKRDFESDKVKLGKRDTESAKKAIDGDLSTYAEGKYYDYRLKFDARWSSPVAFKEIHYYPRQDNGDTEYGIPSYWEVRDTGGWKTIDVEVGTGNPYNSYVSNKVVCTTDTLLGDRNFSCMRNCQMRSYAHYHKLCYKTNVCTTAEQAVADLVKAGRPLVFKCPEGTVGDVLLMGRPRKFFMAEVEVYE